MKNNHLRSHIALAALIFASVTFAATSADADLENRARDIDARILKIDAHTDVLLPSSAAAQFTSDHASQTSIEKLHQGNVGALAIAIAVGPGPRTSEGATAARTEADAKLHWIQTFIHDHPDQVQLASSAADVEKIRASKKIAIIESFQNTRSIGADLGAIDRLYRDGVRLFGFTHAGNNDFADSSRPTDEPAVEHHGLSPLGKQAVTKLNKLGVIIDVSQLTPEGVLQTLALSKAPVIASHSDVRSLVDNTRNLSDAELDAIKINGGVVHLTPFNPYLRPLSQDFDAKAAVLRSQFGLPPTNRKGPVGAEEGMNTLPPDKLSAFIGEFRGLMPKATLKDYIDQLDYIVKRIGVDHVGIGSDFNHGAGISGFADESEAPNVTRELVRRGYTEEQIAKIWGGNFLRVFRRVEAVSHGLQ
jgi:membrane dipeptidase